MKRVELFQELVRFLFYSEQATAPEQIEEIAQPDDIPIDILVNLPAIIAQLEGEYMQLWESASQHNTFAEIKKFAIRLEELGDHYSLNMLRRFGSRLHNYIESFDIDNIEAVLNTYPHMVQKLRFQQKNGT